MDDKHDDCLNSTEISNLYFNQVKSSVEDQGRYVSIVGSIFYVALITLYCSISSDLTSIQKKHFIISFSLSVGMFVLNEVINMIRSYMEVKYASNQWENYYKKESSLQEIQDNIAKRNNSLYEKAFGYWVTLFSISVASGLYSIITLVILTFRL